MAAVDNKCVVAEVDDGSGCDVVTAVDDGGA